MKTILITLILLGSLYNCLPQGIGKRTVVVEIKRPDPIRYGNFIGVNMNSLGGRTNTKEKTGFYVVSKTSNGKIEKSSYLVVNGLRYSNLEDYLRDLPAYEVLEKKLQDAKTEDEKKAVEMEIQELKKKVYTQGARLPVYNKMGK